MEYIMSDIKVIRLTTGEELICTVKYNGIEEDNLDADNVLLLEDIAILIPTQENSLGLAPFMAYTNASAGLALLQKDIMFVCEPVDGLKKQYQTMFNHIVTPSKKIIV